MFSRPATPGRRVRLRWERWAADHSGPFVVHGAAGYQAPRGYGMPLNADQSVGMYLQARPSTSSK